MLKIEYQGQFKRDYKLALKRGCNPELLTEVISMLSNVQELPEQYRDHNLTNSRNYNNTRKCHIQPFCSIVYPVLWAI